MTTRLLSARYGDAFGRTGWTTTLRSCSAYEAYLRTYKHAVDAATAVEFLLLDRLFPRSVFHALTTAEHQPRRARPTLGARRSSTTKPGAGSGASAPSSSSCTSTRPWTTSPSCSRRLQHECADVHAGDRPPLLPRDPRHRVERLTCRGVCGSGTPPRTSTPASCTRRTTRRASRRSTPRTSSPSSTASRCTRRRTSSATATTGAAGCTRFDLHQPHTELTVVGSSLVETAERTPNLDDTVAWDAIDAPGLTDRFFEYLDDTTDDRVRRRHPPVRA